MPNLAFSPVPRPANPEKENDSSSGMPVGGKSIEPSPSRRSSSTSDRPPLESITSEGGPTTSVMVCKRNSSCTCPDCAAAASAFGINELRQVGACATMESDDHEQKTPVVVTAAVARSPLIKQNVATASSAERGGADGGSVGDTNEAVDACSRLPATTATGMIPETNQLEALDDVAASIAVESWQEADAVAGETGAEDAEDASEEDYQQTDKVGATEVVLRGSNEAAATTVSVSVEAKPLSYAHDDGVDDLLADDEDEPYELGGEDNEDVELAAVGGTCAPPYVLGERPGGQEAEAEGLGLAQRDDSRRSSRRFSPSRRLSQQPDMFFECTSEVDQISASDGSDCEGSETEPEDRKPEPVQQHVTEVENGSTQVFHEDGDITTLSSPVKLINSEGPRELSLSSSNARALLTPPATAATKAGSPNPAVVAALEAAVSAHAKSPAQSASAVLETVDNASSLTAAFAAERAPNVADVGLSEGGSGVEIAGVDAARGPSGRRRNRRHMPKMELGLGAGAYEDDDARPRFSQLEVNAKIRERLLEENALFEKTLAEVKAAHEAQLAEAAAELRQSSKAGSRAMMAAKDTDALEQEIAMLSERFGEAAGEARAKSKALIEKETLLDAVTAQLMGLKGDLAAIKSAHMREMQSLTVEVESERRRRAIADNSLAELEVAYNRLEDDERQKRANGILKMKKDMQALAHAQFSAANKKHYAVQARLTATEKDAKQLRETADRHDEQLNATRQQADDFRNQVQCLQSDRTKYAAEAAYREKMLREEVDVSRAAAQEGMTMAETMERELEAAKKSYDLSQDSLARMAIRNSEMKEEVAELQGKVQELEGFCTEALDELDGARADLAVLSARESS